MVAPQRVTPKQYEELVDRWLRENAISIGVCHLPNCLQLNAPLEVVSTSCACGGRGMHVCKVCNDDILYRYATMFVHQESAGECVPRGEVLNPTLPYCPNCSAFANLCGCVHLPKQSTNTETSDIRDWKIFSKTYCVGALIVGLAAAAVWLLCAYS